MPAPVTKSDRKVAAVDFYSPQRIFFAAEEVEAFADGSLQFSDLFVY